MYYIDEYRKNAINKLIPYLLTFPQIADIAVMNADRYQAIEDVLWHIAENFKVDNARGAFLKIIANNEVVDIVYTDTVEDAFTYGSKKPLLQGYGAGHYYSRNSYVSGSSKSISDDKMIRAVKSKIIQNNTDGTIDDFISALKLYFNAEKVGLLEYYPLGVNLVLHGTNLEISTSEVMQEIKKMLPMCVKLNGLFKSDKRYDLFKYDNNSSYGDSRYYIFINDGHNKYNDISNSIKLNSSDNEYIKTNHTTFSKNMFCYIAGSFNDIKNNATIFSVKDTDNQLSLQINNDNKFILNYNNTPYLSDKECEINKNYSILLLNNNGNIQLWINDKIDIRGILLDDTSNIQSTISYQTPNITIENVNDIESFVCINCLNNGNDTFNNFADFTYHSMIFGEYNNKNINIEQYYTTCYGEKQILFNCLDNSNHLKIISNSDLLTDLTTKQTVYNYQVNHSKNRYCYFDGKSGIDYNLLYDKINGNLTGFEISFDISLPIGYHDGIVFSDFIGYDDESYIKVNENGSLILVFKEVTEIEGTDEYDTTEYEYTTSENFLSEYEYYNIKIVTNDNEILLYKNNILAETWELISPLKNTSKIFRIGYINNPNEPLYFNGILRNIKLKIEKQDEVLSWDIPLTKNLKSSTDNIDYTNKGVRFINVPQLIENTNNTDLYNKEITTLR